jgi:hypothetical protein
VPLILASGGWRRRAEERLSIGARRVLPKEFVSQLEKLAMACTSWLA